MRNTSRKTTALNVKLEEELLARIDQIAAMEARTRSSAVRWLLLRGLGQYPTASQEQSQQPASSAA